MISRCAAALEATGPNPRPCIMLLDSLDVARKNPRISKTAGKNVGLPHSQTTHLLGLLA